MENIKERNKSVYEITYMNGKIKEVSQNTVNIMDSIVADIREIIEESISDIEADVKTVRTVVDKALADEYDYDSIYSEIRYTIIEKTGEIILCKKQFEY